MNYLGVPGYSVGEVARRRAADPDLLLLDIRETAELEMAHLSPPFLHVPMSDLVAKGPAALPEELTADPTAEVIVFCHHGARSAQVTAWLRRSGFVNAVNMDGGIDAYAALVDETVGTY